MLQCEGVSYDGWYVLTPNDDFPRGASATSAPKDSQLLRLRFTENVVSAWAPCLCL